MEIPSPIEQAINGAVARHLEAELGSRGLLLPDDELETAATALAEHGARLLTWLIRRSYPTDIHRGYDLTFDFGSQGRKARVEAALAFGAVSARVLTPRAKSYTESFATSVELLCAMFNLGIGLVDGLCDHDAEAGLVLLGIVQAQNLRMAAEEPRARGWLRASVPPTLMENPTVSFTAGVIEAFLEALHEMYPSDTWIHLRRRVGAQLGMALEAERQSVSRSSNKTTTKQLIEFSRLTSVVPFQIMETLVRGGDSTMGPSAGMQLGEAMWRIDDLVDLCDDARSGALNSVLLGAVTAEGRPKTRDVLAALERLIASRDIAGVASEAADKLLVGLRFAGADGRIFGIHTRTSFVYFIQRYAGIVPPPRS